MTLNRAFEPRLQFYILKVTYIFSSLPFSDGRKVKIVYGEAEMRTLLNLIQAIDKNQVLLSTDKSAPVKIEKCEVWKQVTDSFNDITIAQNQTKTYFDYKCDTSIEFRAYS